MNNLAQELEPPVPPEEIAAAEAETPKSDVETPKVETPEAKVEPKKEDEPSPEKLVRLEALHEERGKRKQAQKEFEEYRRKNEAEKAVLADRINQIYAAQQPQAQPPDPNDPLAVLAHGQQTTQQELAALKQRQQQEDQQREHHQRINSMVNWYQQQAQDFEKEAPDFKEAYAHMQKLRVAQIESLGYSPQQVMDALQQDELMVVHNAAQTGQNPAAIIYRMAQNTGWKKADKTAVAPEKKMEAIQKGLEASKTLGQGGQDSGWPTPEQIAKMSEDEFDGLKAKLAKSGKRISDIL